MILLLSSVRAHLDDAFGHGARRLRQVAADPGSATLDDIELLLLAHGVPERTTWDAVDHLAVSELTAPVAWAYAMEYDGAELAQALITASDRSLTEL